MDNTQMARLRLFFRGRFFQSHMALSVLVFGSWILCFGFEAIFQLFTLDALLTILSFLALANLIFSYFLYLEKVISILDSVIDLQREIAVLKQDNRDLRSKLGIVEALANDGMARQVEVEQILKQDAHRRELARQRDARYRARKKQGLSVVSRPVELVALDSDETVQVETPDITTEQAISFLRNTTGYETQPLPAPADEEEHEDSSDDIEETAEDDRQTA